MFRVVKFFVDLQDNKHPYHPGEQFPRDGVKVSNERLLELSTDKNKRHVALIEKVEEEAAEVEETKEPAEDFMNPPEVEVEEAEEPKEEQQKPRKKRGRPRNDAQ